MAVTGTTAEEISVGAGELFYLAETTPNDVWATVGATQEDNVWRILQTFFAPQFNGVVGPIKGTHYLQSETVELEVSLPQMGADLAGIVIPTAEVTPGGTPDLVSGGFSGGLDAAIVAGQWQAIKVSSVTGMSVGDYFRITNTGRKEIRVITRVGTTGSGGTGIDVSAPFVFDHPDTDTYEEVDGSGADVITGGPARRIPTSAYHTFRLDVPGLDGRMTRFYVYNALALGDKVFTASDSADMAPRVTITGTRDGATPATSAWQIEKEGAVG